MIEALRDLNWELFAPLSQDPGDCFPGQEEFTYDASLARIKAINPMNRHQYPWEHFGLKIAGMEGRLLGDLLLQHVYGDMIDSGEWLSMAFERNGNELHTYFDPENLKWNGKIYEVDGDRLIYSSKETFDVTGIKSEKWVCLDKFQENFARRMYTRKFEELPEPKAHIRLPPEGQIWPVGYGSYINRFNMGGSRWNFDMRASRYVHEKEAIRND